MATPRKQDANRRNARKSTGPTSADGKARSSSNARRHGLSAGNADAAVTEEVLAGLLADFPEDFVGREATLLETLASTQARLSSATALEANAVREVARHAPTLGQQGVAREEHAAEARKCMGLALGAARRPIGPYGAADFRHMAATFRLSTKFEPECAQALERLRKLTRYTRDGEALRRRLIKRLAELARDSADAQV